MSLFYSGISYILRALMALRYSVQVKGLDPLTEKNLNRKGGILLLPNHPALMDPLILFIWLWPKFRMRPLIVEFMFRNRALFPIAKRLGAVPIPDFDTGVNQLKIKRAKEALHLLVEGLKKGDHFIVSPAGRIKSTGQETIGGASAAHTLLSECPETNVVLIRTTGLWGSSFSRALTGRSPDMGEAFLKGVKILIKNLIFFAPRRKVVIEIEANPPDFPRACSRIDFNRYLEHWYNQYPDGEGNRQVSEPLTLISDAFWKKELPLALHKEKRKSLGNQSISNETRKKIEAEIRRLLNHPSLEIRPEMSLAFDLGMDSLNMADLAAYLMRNYEIDELSPGEFETVQDLFIIAETKRARISPSHLMGKAVRWPEEGLKRPLPKLPLGRTIPEAFLNSCERMGSYPACGDDFIGVLSYRRLKLGALVLAEYFRSFPETRIAVMLPASAAAFLVIFGLELAGKVPVMLNWTLGPRYLEEMVKITETKRIVTSWRFLDGLSNVDFGHTIDQMVLLEDIKEKITWKNKLRAFFLSKRSVPAILSALKLRDLDEKHPCVIVFTSGTESSPKAVPLSHLNILSNIKSSADTFGQPDANQVMYAILPPFHVFGFNATGLGPFLTGVKSAFYPNPTDGAALAEGIERWKVTMLMAPPSFIQRILSVASPHQLKSVRIYVSGGERPSQEVIERVEKSGATFLEGYGTTECSAAITINRLGVSRKGLGTFLSEHEGCTIHPENLQPLPEGSEGEICIRGPSVFSGYLGSTPSPFIQIHGEKWYRTGDLGCIDKERTLFLSGRIKRFTKLGGEMISLGAVEEALTQGLIHQGKISSECQSLAICADETIPGITQLILFISIPLEKEEANGLLKKAGFSNLIKISLVKRMKEIPLLATGKIDYRTLQKS